MPFARFAMLLSSAMPTASKSALSAVTIPVICTPIIASNASTSTRYNNTFIVVTMNCCAIFSMRLFANMRRMIFIVIFITTTPKINTAKNKTMFHTLFVKKFLTVFQNSFQSNISPRMYGGKPRS